MKFFNLVLSLTVLIFTSACTKSNNQSEASSSSLKSCSFKVLAFSSYTDDAGEMNYDYEEMESWSKEGSHDYAIENNSAVNSASVEIIQKNKMIKKIDLSLEKVGPKLTQLVDKGKVVEQLRGMGELKPKAALRFVFNLKEKKTCKSDIGIFID